MAKQRFYIPVKREGGNGSLRGKLPVSMLTALGVQDLGVLEIEVDLDKQVVSKGRVLDKQEANAYRATMTVPAKTKQPAVKKPAPAKAAAPSKAAKPAATKPAKPTVKAAPTKKVTTSARKTKVNYDTPKVKAPTPAPKVKVPVAPAKKFRVKK